MASLLAYLISFFAKDKPPKLENKYSLPFPQVLHRTITQDQLEQYRHVFVIGDVHGCYDELSDLLVKAKAYGDHTLKVFVGDLFTKGPEPLKVLRALKDMKHVSIRGNHEEVVLREYRKLKEDPKCEMRPDFEWLRELIEEEINYIAELPYTITFPSLNAIIVHGGLIPGKALNLQSPVDMVRMRNIAFTDYFEGEGIVVQERAGIGGPWAELWPGPQHVYFGHDARRGLQKYSHATGLDTGCYYGRSLTGVFISGPWKGEMVSVNARENYFEKKSSKACHSSTGTGSVQNFNAP